MTANPLTQAILAAGKELADAHGWNFDGDPYPAENSVFVEVMTIYLEPLVGEGWKAARIKALKAELEELEQDI